MTGDFRSVFACVAVGRAENGYEGFVDDCGMLLWHSNTLHNMSVVDGVGLGLREVLAEDA